MYQRRWSVLVCENWYMLMVKYINSVMNQERVSCFCRQNVMKKCFWYPNVEMTVFGYFDKKRHFFCQCETFFFLTSFMLHKFLSNNNMIIWNADLKKVFFLSKWLFGENVLNSLNWICTWHGECEINVQKWIKTGPNGLQEALTGAPLRRVERVKTLRVRETHP